MVQEAAVVPLGRRGAGSGAGPDGEWRPEFPGQRAPFPPGNTAAQVSGSRGRAAEELAGQFEAALYADPLTPGYLKSGQFARSVRAWARSEAQCELLWEVLNEMGLMRFATEETRGTEREKPGAARDGSGPGMRRKMRQERIPPLLDALHKAETRASALRSKLGLDPQGFTQLAKDVSLARRQGEHDPIERLAAGGREITERRAAREAAGRSGAGVPPQPA